MLKQLRFGHIFAVALQLSVFPYVLIAQEAELNSYDLSSEGYFINGYGGGGCEACAPVDPGGVLGPILGPLNPVPATPETGSLQLRVSPHQTLPLAQAPAEQFKSDRLEALGTRRDWLFSDQGDSATSRTVISGPLIPGPVDPDAVLKMVIPDNFIRESDTLLQKDGVE